MSDQKSNVLPIRTQDMDALRNQVREIIADGISQAQVCRESGVTSGQLSPWLKDKYTGDNDAVADKLRHWLSARDRRAALAHTLPVAPPWMETPTARKIVSVLAYSQMAGDIGCIYGGAGLGKTVTLKAYADSNPSVWIAEMNPCSCAVASALEVLCDVTGVQGTAGRPVRMLADICKRLKGTGGLLIVDEAQHLRLEALEALRAIHDQTGIGLVLCGNESVYARLTGGKREATFAQLFSRLGKRLRLTRPVKGDVEQLADHYAVTGVEERRLLVEIASKPGALRGLVKTLRLAGMFAAGETSQGITADHIRAAWRDLGGVE